jgi:hypothetical protein
VEQAAVHPRGMECRVARSKHSHPIFGRRLRCSLDELRGQRASFAARE